MVLIIKRCEIWVISGTAVKKPQLEWAVVVSFGLLGLKIRIDAMLHQAESDIGCCFNIPIFGVFGQLFLQNIC